MSEMPRTILKCIKGKTESVVQMIVSNHLDVVAGEGLLGEDTINKSLRIKPLTVNTAPGPLLSSHLTLSTIEIVCALSLRCLNHVL